MQRDQILTRVWHALRMAAMAEYDARRTHSELATIDWRAARPWTPILREACENTVRASDDHKLVNAGWGAGYSCGRDD